MAGGGWQGQLNVEVILVGGASNLAVVIDSRL
jgi:hypothetical protein